MKNTLQLDFSNKASNVSFAEGRVTKIWGEGLGWTQQEARAVLADHTEYLAHLQSVGIQTSKILSRDVCESDDGSFTILETEAYCGKDASIALLDSASVEALVAAVANDFRAIASVLLSIPARDSEQYSISHPWISVPADLKPQNVVVADSSQPILIDTFGPKLWQNGKIKPLSTRTPGKGQIRNDEIKVGDVRFALGRLSGYFVALSTRWLVAAQPEASIAQINNIRGRISTVITPIVSELVLGNKLFEQSYARLLISDTQEPEFKSIEKGTFEGPLYVQRLYEKEQRAHGF